MARMTCFFIGHRDAPRSLQPQIREAVEQHIVRYSVTRFLVGHYGLFDAMAADAVIQAKEEHPNITLEMLIPYHPAECQVELPKGFDDMYYPFAYESVPRRLSIVRANRAAVQEAKYLIAYARYPGNSRNLLDYAKRLEKKGGIHITNLA